MFEKDNQIDGGNGMQVSFNVSLTIFGAMPIPCLVPIRLVVFVVHVRRHVVVDVNFPEELTESSHLQG